MNGVTFEGAYPIPKMNERLDSLRERHIFSTSTVKSGMGKSISRIAKRKKGFNSRHGITTILRTWFTLKNAAIAFQCWMDNIMSAAAWQSARVYLENVAISLKAVEEHMETY